MFVGKYEPIGKDVIRVSELPIGYWTQDFKDHLEFLMETTDKKGKTGLMIAAEKFQIDILIELINRGADLDIQNKSKNTALHFAVYKESNQALRILIDAGANLEIKGYGKQTPLVLAAEADNASAVEMMIPTTVIINSNPRASGMKCRAA